MQIGSLIRRAALHFGEAPCLVEGERVVWFREFDRLTDKLGNALLAAGFVAGDRVGVLLPNGIDCLVAYYALAKAGLVRVGMNTRETLDNHAYKLADSGSRGVIHAMIDAAEIARLGVERPIGSAEFDDSRRRRGGALRGRPGARRALSARLHRRHDRALEGGHADDARRAVELSAFLTDLTPDLARGQTRSCTRRRSRTPPAPSSCLRWCAARARW